MPTSRVLGLCGQSLQLSNLLLLCVWLHSLWVGCVWLQQCGRCSRSQTAVVLFAKNQATLCSERWTRLFVDDVLSMAARHICVLRKLGYISL